MTLAADRLRALADAVELGPKLGAEERTRTSVLLRGRATLLDHGATPAGQAQQLALAAHQLAPEHPLLAAIYADAAQLDDPAAAAELDEPDDGGRQ